MGTHSNYKIEISGTSEELTAVGRVLNSTFENDSYNNVNINEVYSNSLTIYINNTYEVALLEDITNMAMKMAKAASCTTFIIAGEIDASEVAGEYMKFRISYSQNEIEKSFSFWYMEPNRDVKEMSYEEFCEESFDEYSEEDFKKMQNGWYMVETREGTVMMETVPLNQVEKIKIE